MSTLPQRIQIALDYAGISWSKAATNIGLSAQAATKWKKGQIGKDTLKKLSDALKVQYLWLATGEGEMAAPLRENQINESDTQQMGFWDSETPLQDGEFEASFYKDAEFLGGSGFDADIYDDGRRKIRYAYTAARRAGANPSKVICTTLVGDSMEELILNGSMIAIDTSKKDIREGKIYAFRHGNMLRVKYLLPRPDGGLIIRSHNSRYTDEIITGEEIENENIQIIGWVWNWSSLVVW